MRVGLAGKMASGKDTIGLTLRENKDKEMLLLSFAGGLRNEITETLEEIKSNNFIKPDSMPDDLYELLLDESKEDKIDVYKRTNRMRQILQKYGTEYRRKEKDSYWVDKLEETIKKNKDKSICVTDARFINELDMLKGQGFYLVKINISDEEQEKRLRNRDGNSIKRIKHISESAFEDYKDFDLEIDNNNKTPIEAVEEILKNIGGWYGSKNLDMGSI